LTRSHSCSHAHKHARFAPHAPAALRQGVDLKRRPPKSRPAGSLSKHGFFRSLDFRSRIAPQGLRRHVSLSSYSLVKQPGTRSEFHPPVNRRAAKPMTSDWDRKPGHRISVRSFEDAPSHRGGGVPKAYICFGRHPCQHKDGQKFTLSAAVWCTPATAIFLSNMGLSRPGKAPRRRTWATFLRPLDIAVGDCHFGGIASASR